ICVPVSAKSGEGVGNLLDMILLVADVNKEKISANPERLAAGSVIESHIDKGEGPVATVLVQTGTIKKNDYLGIGGYLYGRVRAMKDWRGQGLESAPPGTPVKVLGWKLAPQVGDIFEIPEDVSILEKKARVVSLSRADTSTTLLRPAEGAVERKEFHIILKTDVLGSLEAILSSLQKLETPQAAPEVIQKGLGNITDADVRRAVDTGAQVFGFNVFATPEAAELARDKGIVIRTYKIIYDLLDAVRAELFRLLPKEIIRTALGKLKVIAIFRTERDEQILGGVVLEGRISKDAKIEVFHGGELIAPAMLLELQCGKQEVKEVTSGRECGIKIKTKDKSQIGDVLEFYKEETREIKL
ncbi:MAG: translation initiation factor IF-2, partial [Candidatus Magasanikbacteria bacterium]|nr:translation initiation factor IF-2 [Candidatus Magasanikbacteria bacterium]